MKASKSQLSLASKHSRNQQNKLKIPLLQRVLQYLSKSFVGSNKLRIWQTYDYLGNNWWHAFDPVTGRNTSVNSKEKLQAWIELTYSNKSSYH